VGVRETFLAEKNQSNHLELVWEDTDVLTVTLQFTCVRYIMYIDIYHRLSFQGRTAL
jgi:hypothetical protein